MLLFFFSFLSQCVMRINNILSIGMFLLPYHLYHYKLGIQIFLLIFFGVFFIGHQLTVLLYNELEDYSYNIVLYDFCYYFGLLFLVNININYIMNIISLYNANISSYYVSIALIIMIFLFIIIKNQTEKLDILLISIKIFLSGIIIYFFFLHAHQEVLINLPRSISFLPVIPLLFFSFLTCSSIFNLPDRLTAKVNVDEKFNNQVTLIENNNLREKQYDYLAVVVSISIVVVLYILFTYYTLAVFAPYSFFLTSFSQTLLTYYYNNKLIHVVNLLILVIAFFTIYIAVLVLKKIIEKNIAKIIVQTNAISEIIILFCIFFCIVIMNKINIVEKNNIIAVTIFFSLTFLIIHFKVLMANNLNKKIVFIQIGMIAIIGIILCISIWNYFN
jgi:hypothetical protein